MIIFTHFRSQEPIGWMLERYEEFSLILIEDSLKERARSAVNGMRLISSKWIRKMRRCLKS